MMKTSKDRRGFGPQFAVAALVCLAAVTSYRVQFADYVFDPLELQEIARQSIERGGENTTLLFEAAEDLLREKYGRHINDPAPWMWNNAGGAMGAMKVLHCSLTEYVIIFGTPLGTSGHSGRFWAEDWFMIIFGEQWSSFPESPKKEVYGPGMTHYLRRGVAKQYRMPDECWAIEYARGNILSMMPFGIADTLTSTLDFQTLYATARISAIGIVHEIIYGKNPASA